MTLKKIPDPRTPRRIGLTIILAGVLSISSALATPEPVQALGWSDITGAAKSVGRKAKKAAKRAGSGFKGLASGAAKGAKEAGAFTKDMGKGMAKTTRDAALAATADVVVGVGDPIRRGLDKLRDNPDPNQRRRDMEYTRQKITGLGAAMDGKLNDLKNTVLDPFKPGTITSHNTKRGVKRRAGQGPRQWRSNRRTTTKLPARRAGAKGKTARDRSVLGRPLGAQQSRTQTSRSKVQRRIKRNASKRLTREFRPGQSKVKRRVNHRKLRKNVRRHKQVVRGAKRVRIKRHNRKRFSRQLRRNNRVSRGFKVRRNKRGGFRNRSNRRRR